MNRNYKLYTRLNDVFISDCISKTKEKKFIYYQKINSIAYVCWPNGRPCLPINMYLIDNSYLWTGNSAVTYASELSELIRYCARAGKGFNQIDDGDVYAFVDQLRSKSQVTDKHQRVRNDNTVRRILQRCLDFLNWYSNNLHHGSKPLLGERKDSPSVVCEKKKNPHNGRYYWSHRCAPEAHSTEPKIPIGLRVIEDIEDVIDRLGDPSAYPEPALRRFKNDTVFHQELLNYLYERRIFMIWMLKRTGLRPEELIRMPVKENQQAVAKQILTLPTLKRRKRIAPYRSFPITLKDGRVVLRYLSARKRWIEVCKGKFSEYKEQNSMFLSTEPGKCGANIGKTGLEKDFEKLSRLAGYKDKQACFSMFRHRFITYEVLSHLKQWENHHGNMVNEQDYRTILERVRKKTGHGNVDSLWHYIDIAREMDGAWGNIDRAVGRLHAAENLKLELEILKRDLRQINTNRLAAEQIVDMVSTRLTDIIRDARNSGLQTQSAD
ncbi:hypothetical protein H4684_003130 [Desulfomicrobium macestii]|uniref:Tyr recombinase domain-containing protein n=1 Tax=Desulfomicrobium macestii TaxID=90731 RepID=A0ABR9H6Z2_9BACT|nr:site-specific integrase [Desulfomicrobium macestii]MBE1426464.1 hypothetical protein [Desulfomicrobium macestii]